MSEERGRVSRRDFLAGTLVGTLAGTLAGTGGLWIDAAMPRPLAAAEARDDRSARALAPREWTRRAPSRRVASTSSTGL